MTSSSDKRIFIIGNGPSLSPRDLDLIKDEDSFGINRIGMIFSKTEWRPSYFICATFRTKWSQFYRRDVNRVIDLGIPCYIGERIKGTVNDAPNVTYIKCLHIDDDPEEDWWEDISGGKVSIYGQTLFGAIRIATFLGYNKLYLLGVDGGYKNTGKDGDENHFDPAYEEKRHRDGGDRLNWQIKRVQASHELLARNSLKHGFQIYNVSRNSYIDTYPKRSLEDVI